MSIAIEGLLTEMASSIDYGPEPDLVRRVSAAIRTRPAPVLPSIWRRVQILAAAASVALAVWFTVVPAGREALADWLGVDGIRLKMVENLPAVETRADDIVPGDLVSLAQAQEGASFEVKGAALLGSPDEIYLDDSIPGGMVSLVYYPSDGLPAAGTTGVGALLTEFTGSITGQLIEKMIDVKEGVVDPVEVNGVDGYFLHGDEHIVLFEDVEGNVRESYSRLAGNTLLWTQSGITYRLEADVSLARALEIAASVAD